MTDLNKLSPQSRAVLSLVLAQSKGFEEIADLLDMQPIAVRSRARHAAMQLEPPPDAVDRKVRGPIVDYLLGQDSVSSRMQVRARLREEGPAREWALMLSEALEPLAQQPLPTIPQIVEEPEDEKTSRRAGRGRRWGIFGALVLVLVGAVAGLVVALASSSSTTGRGPSASTVRSGRTHSRNAVETIRHLVLAPTSADPSALGAGAVVRQRGALLLLLQARGLAANHGDSYGVWLFNTPVDARLLGFVSPPVGAAGTFSSGVSLPDDAIRFHSLIVTRETSQRPASPGMTLLHSSLSLS